MPSDRSLLTPGAVRKTAMRVVESDEDHVKAVAFNMLFMVWRRRTLGPVYRRALYIARNLAVQFPEGVGVCQVVEIETVPPDSDARAAFIDFLRLDQVKHLAVIHDGVGFKAASVRAIMAGVQAMARAECKHAVFGDIAAASRWHAAAQADLGRSETAGEIEGIIGDVRRLPGGT